jgi:hypothetical protein
MNRTATIILAAAALVGVTAAAIISAVKMGAFERAEEEHETPQNWFHKLAKGLDRDISNIERRTSQRYHDKKQEILDNLDWDQEQTHREDIKRNGCPFPAG